MKPTPSTAKKLPAFLWGILLFMISVILGLCARTIPGFAHGYSTRFYPLLAGSLGRFSSLFPFSLSEFSLFLLLFFLVRMFLRLWKSPLLLLGRIFFLCSFLLFLFTVNCGVNYYRSPFSSEASISSDPHSLEELKELCTFLTSELNKARKEIEDRETEEKGSISSSFSVLSQAGTEGRKAMIRLGEQFPQLAGYYPRPKPVFFSRMLSIQQLCGVYSPFTIEANYNREMPFSNIPHTICHELSHLRGYMREDEANFISYLACIHSPSPAFRYSGLFIGWIHATNALAEADRECFLEIYHTLDEQVIRDLEVHDQFWSQFEGPVAEASAQVNDAYLKAHSQEAGIQSYGRMVDLMLSYYEEMLSAVSDSSK